MTVATTGGPANPWGEFGDVGLEDVSPSDIQMPRLVIDHDKAVFKDSSTGQEIPTLECIILGLTKQRIMWDSQIDTGDKPQCKAPNNEIGYPQMRTDIPARKQFPWSKSVFDPADQQADEDGQIALPCAACNFKEWGKDSEKPPCSEQYTFGLYYKDSDGDLRPGIISFQRSGLKVARTYAGTFATAKQPMFTVWTTIKLQAESRGKTVYATPKFQRGGGSAPESWQEYADTYRSVREFLHQKPRAATKEEDDKAAAARTSRPAPASAAAATTIEADDPWSAPAAPPAAPAPARPTAPVTPAYEAGVAAATATDDPDDLPF